jgi:hypothetical protein
MPPILYARGETSSDGTRVSYTLTGPALLHPDGRGQEAIRKAEQAAVRAAGRQARTKAIGAYSPPAIKAGWELQTRTVGSILIEVRNPVPLARMVEEPTKPHEIVPHSKKALHWGGPRAVTCSPRGSTIRAPKARAAFRGCSTTWPAASRRRSRSG